ncbi:hypothetical protein R1flu_014476 [Riccia fluitans]|uniref:AAA+ ATPase domain-containing protein n=1 Tax=Riccia fluitans TaxID=41844 RepID=A0ABD1YGK0_9MARC
MEKSMTVKPFVFITGSPGVGKTTLIIKVLERVRGNYPNLPIHGATSFHRPTPASSLMGGRAAPKVGKYYVDVGQFEDLALAELAKNAAQEAGNDGNRLFLIDEVGKMELFIPGFFSAVWDGLNSDHAIVLGTIPVTKFGKEIPEVARIRNRPDVAVYVLTKSYREAMVDSVFSHIDSLVNR